MKKHVVISLLGCVVATLYSINSGAQEQSLLVMQQAAPVASKDAFVFSSGETDPDNHTIIYVKAKVMHSFLEYFNNANQVLWNFSNNHYLVDFKSNGRLCRALFDTKGHLIYTIKTGTETNLPHDVRKQLKSNYADYVIGAVSEVYNVYGRAWIVNLQDADNLIVAQISNGTLEELNHYRTHF